MLQAATLREMLEKKLLTPRSRKKAVPWAIQEEERRACMLVGIAATTYRYKAHRSADGELRRRLGIALPGGAAFGRGPFARERIGSPGNR
jgi:hypothetical protein